jgi:hypothetical protein
MPNQPADPMRVGEGNTGLLRRRLIFADPERSVVRISHDGKRVAFRAPSTVCSISGWLRSTGSATRAR